MSNKEELSVFAKFEKEDVVNLYNDLIDKLISGGKTSTTRSRTVETTNDSDSSADGFATTATNVVSKKLKAAAKKVI